MKKLIWLLVTAAVLQGCASDPRSKQGLQWILDDAAEKRRLNDAGFPQYNHAG